MVIKNFLYGLALFSFLLIQGCTVLTTRTEKTPPAGPPAWPETETQAPEEPPTPPPPQSIPKLGLIFGPGGARTYAMIGFLQELQKYKIPVHSVGGTEWGAMIGAYYSLKGSVNEVEWQLGKIKADDIVKKSLVSGQQMNSVSVLNSFFNDSLGRQTVEAGDKPFACPAFNMNRNQTYIMKKGPYRQLLPYCLAYPPLFKPYSGNLSGIREIKLLADHLRSQGANYIVLVNVLGAPGVSKKLTGSADTIENLYWNEIAAAYTKPWPGVDQVVNLDVDGFTLFDFDKKRSIIQKGSSSGAGWVQEYSRRFGF